ncbi:CapA family protein [Metabacillus arenae]|uniref:CapA family protein n=1 Tax=Metabacillus arenae TaxID=2771434 RepID=A0A926NEH0_9BACI|nr:CapA family protein [Metabacillus arenae]MBD1379350.1 CapA family protein [Metabacillus arenae]
MKLRLSFYLLFAITTVLLVLLITVNPNPGANGSSEKVSRTHSEKNSSFHHKDFQSTIQLSAIGDILIHSRVYDDAKQKNGGYDFTPMISEVKPLLEKADFTMANQETMVGGTEIGLSTYPSFNSPFEVADGFQEAGIDLVTIANNHTLDRGEKAIMSALNYYDKIKMPYVGSYKNNNDAQTPRVINKNGIRLGFLAYTYGTNGIPVPEGKPYLVDLIDKEKMKEDIHKIKQRSDVLIVSMHWGLEYQRLPNDEQKDLAQFLADQGVHVVIGHHPHVLQPMEWVSGKNGHEAFVIYSLGNFLSGQEGTFKEIGGILSLDIQKTTNKKGTNIQILNPEVNPTIVKSNQQQNYRVHSLENVNEKQNEEMIQHMNQFID